MTSDSRVVESDLNYDSPGCVKTVCLCFPSVFLLNSMVVKPLQNPVYTKDISFKNLSSPFTRKIFIKTSCSVN